MLVEIDGDLPCHTDAFRVSGEGYHSGLVLLSALGPVNAVRASWAKLFKVSGRRRSGSITVGGRSVGLMENIPYLTASAPLDRGHVHMVVFHPMLGHNAPDLGFVYQVGPDAPLHYFDRMARWCPVPMRPSWRAPLWALGREHGAIVPLTGHGREVWHVATTREVWEPIICGALSSKELQ